MSGVDRTASGSAANTPMAPLLTMRGITKKFGGVTALDGVDLEVRAGEVHAVCGENGAGKSTLMKILSGAIEEYGGDVQLRGTSVRFTGPRDAAAQGVSIIHQELNLVPELSAAANIFLGREITRARFFLDDRTMQRQCGEWFNLLGAAFSPAAKVRNLRIGDQQLVEIAKALSLESDVIIMDEPTSALAEAEVANLFRVIAELKRRNAAVIYISHKMDEVFEIADRISVLRDGRMVKTVDRSAASPNEVIAWMVGREIADWQAGNATQIGREVLRVEGLWQRRRDRPNAWHLEDVSFDLRAGEVLGIAGLLGSGRTELLETLFGAGHGIHRGRVLVDGVALNPKSPREAMDAGVALVTEDRRALGLFEQLNVGHNISLSSLADFCSFGFVRGRRERRAVLETIERLRIRTAGFRAPILSLSGGNQQKCIIARWLLTRPKIFLLDEPTRGIDVGAKAEIYRLLRELCAQGMGVVMTSSELPELLAVCDRIIVLCEGRIAGRFDRSEATEEKIVHAAMDFRSRSATKARSA